MYDGTGRHISLLYYENVISVLNGSFPLFW